VNQHTAAHSLRTKHPARSSADEYSRQSRWTRDEVERLPVSGSSYRTVEEAPLEFGADRQPTCPQGTWGESDYVQLLPEAAGCGPSATVNTRTAAVVAERVGHQLTRAPHVVVDLGEVTAVDPRGLTVFRTLHRRPPPLGPRYTSSEPSTTR
jgi:hypothetical protein